MNKQKTFKTWIKQFEGQDDTIGDLADDIKTDGEFPQTDDYDKIKTYLNFKGASDAAINVFYEVWKKYKV